MAQSRKPPSNDSDVNARLDVIEAQLADHETRLTALENVAPPDVEQPPDIEQPPPDEGESLQALVDRGGDIDLPKDYYADFCTANVPVDIIGMPTTIDVSGLSISNGKGIFDAQANLAVEDLVLRGASVNDNNGCAVRGAVGVSVDILRCEITGNEMGVLLAGGQGAILEIVDCRIHDNGLPSGGLGHEVYINSMPKAQYGETYLSIRDSGIIGGPRSCVALKSRASHTNVSNCELRGSTSSDGSIAGRVVDLPDGGELLIENCEIELRSTSPTGSILGACTESTSQGAASVTLRNVLIRDSRGRGGEFWARAGVGCRLVLEDVRYTASAAPSLTGWDHVEGGFTKAI